MCVQQRVLFTAAGPGTIVGSAAFNLFVIVAVCVVAPGVETRQIADMPVFVRPPPSAQHTRGQLRVLVVATTPLGMLISCTVRLSSSRLVRGVLGFRSRSSHLFLYAYFSPNPKFRGC